ncbi:MAG: S-layer homology domain-containing protein [Candidatus Peribacteraceae bacterium]|nr:S-layer homology domain-containing protein [Candidatus Peribacteraceae bacterium]MDD5739912.1 S-layer homology domain-containing protein [Candidatus Peribacteraceae bacterium]
MRTHLSVSVSLVFITLLTPRAIQAAFPDVPASNPYADSINYVQSEGIVSGYPDGTFGPSKTINRAEFTKIIVGSTGKDIVQNGACFTDVANEWFAVFVCTAKNLDVIGGYPDGTFRPERLVTFVEAAKIISLAYGLTLPSATDMWFERFVVAMEESRAIPVSISALDAPLARGEMAEMIARLRQNDRGRPSQTFNSLMGHGNSIPAMIPANNGASSSSVQAEQAIGSLPFEFVISQDWASQWHLTGFTADNLVNPYHDPVEYMTGNGDDPAFLRLHYPEGSGSPFVAHNYNKPFGGVSEYVDGDYPSTDHIVLRYDIRVPKDFPFHAGGILPGIYSGLRQNLKGGTRSYIIIHWDTDGRISLGGRVQMRTGGSPMLSEESFPADDQWHTVEVEAKMNEGKTNRGGYAIVRVDGEETVRQDNLIFRTDDSELFDGIAFFSYFGSLSTNDSAPRDTYVDIANIVLLKK